MFARFIERTRDEPFAWGRNDCALWVSAAVEDCTGIDPAADLRGTYSSRFECHQILKRNGGLSALVSSRMSGFASIAGDGVGLVRLDGQPICGLIISGRVVVKMATGLRVADDFQLMRGWSW